MPMFGGKHFANPAVGRMHEKMGGNMDAGKGEEVEKGTPKSVHGDFHEDGTAHVHIHHEDGSHEHVDHATHEEAKDHMKSAMGEEGDESFQDWAKEEAEEPEHMSMRAASRMSGGAY